VYCAAYIAADHILRHPPACLHRESSHSQERLRTVLELGAGTGVTGLALTAGLSAHVTITDTPALLPLMSTNIHHNTDALKGSAGTCRAASLMWGAGEPLLLAEATEEAAQIQEHFTYDIIVAADCVYEDNCPYDLLVETIVERAHADTYVLLVHRERLREPLEEVERLLCRHFSHVTRGEPDSINRNPHVHMLEARGLKGR
jgi:predicted nicotinamide N-methyase